MHSDPSLLTIDYFIFFINVSLHNLFVDRCTNLFSQAKLCLMVEDKEADLVPFIDHFERTSVTHISCRLIATDVVMCAVGYGPKLGVFLLKSSWVSVCTVYFVSKTTYLCKHLYV